MQMFNFSQIYIVSVAISPNYFTLTLLSLQNKSHDLITHANLPQSLPLKPSTPLKYKNLTTGSVHLVTFYNSLFSLFLKMLQYILLPPLFYVNFHYNMRFVFSLNSINTFSSQVFLLFSLMIHSFTVCFYIYGCSLVRLFPQHIPSLTVVYVARPQ